MTATDDDDASQALAHPDYWDKRYAAGSSTRAPTHEWFMGFDDLLPFFELQLFRHYSPESNPMIVHLGSGDSTVPRDLATRGYRNQLCLDFSQVLVDLMAKRDGRLLGIEWRCADVCQSLQLPPASVDVAFDKGTLDAMIHGSPWNPPEEVVRRTADYVRNVHRILKPGGRFLCISFRPRHFVRPRLELDGLSWETDVACVGGQTGLPYNGFAMRKLQPASEDAATAPASVQ